MISRWTILNLRERPERKLLAACSARRAGVPDDIIHFHHGDVFQTPEELVPAALAQGLYIFESMLEWFPIPENDTITNEGEFKLQNQSYNILCYLRDRIERDTYEVFIHDDVYLYDATGYEYLCDICQKIGDFNILLLNQSYSWAEGIFTDPQPLERAPEVAPGLNSNCDFALVLSQEGAKMIYERMLDIPIVAPVESLVCPRDEEERKWDPEEAYTIISDIAIRYDETIAGSDTFDYHEFKGKHQKHLEETDT